MLGIQLRLAKPKFLRAERYADDCADGVCRARVDRSRHRISDDEYLRVARSVCDFILKDLPRSVDNESELCFSYAPNSNTRIFNASLLAAEVLASVGKLTGEHELFESAERATRYVVNNQRPDGSWSYGTDPKQSWIDNFHTAYVLFSLEANNRRVSIWIGVSAGVGARLRVLEEQLLSCGGVAEILP